MTENKNNTESTKENRNLPTTAQFEAELKRLRYRQKFIKTLWNTISSLIVVAAIAIIISTMLLPVLRVTGTSMTPTLQNDEILICNKLGEVKQGDIIAFYYNNKVLLKRVIGLLGDTIDIAEDGTVYRNGEALEEKYVNELALGEKDIETPITVPESRYFVCGDILPSKVIQNNELRATLKMPILRNYRKTANFRKLADIRRYWGNDTK